MTYLGICDRCGDKVLVEECDECGSPYCDDCMPNHLCEDVEELCHIVSYLMAKEEDRKT